MMTLYTIVMILITFVLVTVLILMFHECIKWLNESEHDTNITNKRVR